MSVRSGEHKVGVVVFFKKNFCLEILVYTDEGVGASANCVAMTLASLKDTISRTTPHYTVRMTTSKELVGSKWRDSCQLLVMPGGRDLPYCKELGGHGNHQISTFVHEGGSYLGICAGGYYGAAYVEFAEGDLEMEIVGSRELAFFAVTAKGPVFPGFKYEANEGARAVGVAVTQEGGAILGLAKGTSYLFYNGGCGFTANYKALAGGEESPYHIMLAYTGISQPCPLDTTPSTSPALICGGVGRGRVILSGLHIEASVTLLEECYHGDAYVTALLPTLRLYEPQRRNIFDSCLSYLIRTDLKSEP